MIDCFQFRIKLNMTSLINSYKYVNRENLDIISKLVHHYKIYCMQKKGCNTLIDVGCHKGEFLSSFLKIKIFKKFYCFEPQKEIYKNLKKKFKNNKKVKLYNYSLGEKESKKKMYLSNLMFIYYVQD